MHADAQADTQADTEADTEADANAEAGADTKVDAKADTKADAKVDTEAGINAVAEDPARRGNRCAGREADDAAGGEPERCRAAGGEAMEEQKPIPGTRRFGCPGNRGRCRDYRLLDKRTQKRSGRVGLVLRNMRQIQRNAVLRRLRQGSIRNTAGDAGERGMEPQQGARAGAAA